MAQLLRFTDGKILRNIRIHTRPLGTPTATAAPEPVHHIVIVDRSGSMWGSMEELREALTKMTGADEYKGVTSTLISYSGRGDVREHWTASASPRVSAIQDLRPTGLTSLSGALARAVALVEQTKGKAVVTVHSDGYVNDPSPRQERVSCDAAVAKIAASGKAIVNTIAYGHYCDWSYLASLATAGGGRCLQVANGTLRELHDALYEGVAGLASGAVAAIEVTPEPGAYLTLVCDPERRTVTRVTDTQKVAVSNSAQLLALVEGEGDGDGGGRRAMAAAALSYALAGDLRAAKDYALSAGFPAFQAHSRALVSSQIAAFVKALEDAVFAPHYVSVEPASLIRGAGTSSMAVITALSHCAGKVEVDVTDLLSGYKRRGVKRVAAGNPEVKVEPVDPQWATLSNFSVNRDSPVVNMLLSRPATLKLAGAPQTRIAGVQLNGLTEHRNYTVVADGEVTIKRLRLRTVNKTAAGVMRALGASDEGGGIYTVSFEDRPLDGFDEGGMKAPERSEIERLIRLYGVQKFFAAALKGTSTEYDANTVAELKKYDLSPGGNYNPPTKNPYERLEDAIADGTIDTRTNYRVSWGVDEIRFMSDLPSANEFLKRRFVAHHGGAEIKDPKLPGILSLEGVTFAPKALSARTKLNKADELLFPLYEQLLGLAPVGGFLQSCLVQGPIASISEDDRAVILARVTDAVDAVYDDLRPSVFYVGCVGSPPESFGMTPLTPEAFAELTGLKVPSSESEALYYRTPDGAVLTVLAEVAYFSTEKGLAA